MGIRARGCDLRVLLIWDATPFTGGLVHVSLGNRKRGSSAIDLVFAIVMFDCDEYEDLSNLGRKRRESKLPENRLAEKLSCSPKSPECW